ncbi:MAG: hypothetical protein ABIT37_06670 [Luteolibacter sp.]
MKYHLALTILLAALITPASAMFMRPQMVPVDRLLKNAETNLAAHPDSDEAHYIVARIHYLAFARCSTSVPAFSEADQQGKPALPPNWMIDTKRSEDLDDTKLAAHANAALTGFRELVKKDAANGLHQLGLASLLEQISEWKERAKPAELPADLKAVTRDQARDAYLAAFRASLGKDSTLKHQPISGLESLVSYEAGKAFIRLAGAKNNAGADLGSEAKEVREGLVKLDAIPPSGAVTPIIFSMRPVGGVDELLAPGKVVHFDLRGYGPAGRTTWLQPDTALLVWDPAKRGDITSGQQLFGGYSFQIFRATGYDALAALDDDGNGVLEGLETGGIRAWFDCNGDAVSASGEMRDLSELGIVGIKVRATGKDGSHPTCDKGLMLRDGTTLPTWDWMALPVKN